MMVLVANLGSTSFKYKLFDMRSDSDDAKAQAHLLADGASDRIGQEEGHWYLQIGQQVLQGSAPFADHAQAIDHHLAQLLEGGAIEELEQVQAIGFKAVHGGPISGAVRVDKNVIEIMKQFSDVAPQHNPPYIAAMKAFAKKLPKTPQVAAFETGFHQTIPLSRQVYGIPHEWTKDVSDGGLGIRRYGFHGASHRYIATRMAELLPQASRIISCHLGGSCSICAIRDGQSVANSFGMTAQSGTFHASRVGDFDAFCILKLLKSGMDIDSIFDDLGNQAGLKGLSGVSSDMREVEKAAAKGNDQAKLAIDAFVETCRHYLGAYLAVLNGADAIVFTGGIGQNSPTIRARICDNLGNLGVRIDDDHNKRAVGTLERRIDCGLSEAVADHSMQLWVLPTNEELIVARQTIEVLGRSPSKGKPKTASPTQRVEPKAPLKAQESNKTKPQTTKAAKPPQPVPVAVKKSEPEPDQEMWAPVEPEPIEPDPAELPEPEQESPSAADSEAEPTKPREETNAPSSDESDDGDSLKLKEEPKGKRKPKWKA